jgi:hypothetical protein
MLALMGARLDKNIDFETIRKTAKKANSYTKAYSNDQRQKLLIELLYMLTDQCGHPTMWDSGCELHSYMICLYEDLGC